MAYPRILIIEDDRDVLAIIQEALVNAGYDVVTANDGEHGLSLLIESTVNLILLDTAILDAKGEAVFTDIRRATDLPVIVFGDKGEAFEALESGADAFMVKPPNLREMLARVRNLLRRTMKENDGDDGFGSGPTRFARDDKDNYPANLNLRDDYQLSSSEVKLTACLLKNKGELVRYSKIIEEVWGGKKVTKDLLHYYVRRLRTKLYMLSRKRVSVVNIRGLGYRMDVTA